MRLKDKVVVITGGTKGIGRVTAIMMAQQGAKVAFTGRSDNGLEVEERMREAGGQGLFVRADNKEEEQVAAAIHKAAETFGPITTLMNNAIATDDVGSGKDSHVDELDTAVLDDDQIRDQFEQLVLTPYLGESTDIANGAIYLASDESKYVTGTMLTIDGGALCHQAQPQLDFSRLRGDA